MKLSLTITLLFSLVASALAQAFDHRYIIMLRRDADIDEYLDKIAAVGDVEEILRWHGASIFYGVVVRSLSHTPTTLGAYPEVLSVELDQIVTIPNCPVDPCRKTDLFEEADRYAAAHATVQPQK